MVVYVKKKGGNIEYSNGGPLVFNNGIPLTLDLNGHNIKSTGSNDGIAVGYGTFTNTGNLKSYKDVKKDNNLTIIGSGTIESAKDTNTFRLYGPEYAYPNLAPSEYSQLTIGRKGGNDDGVL